jgi:quinol monooxygenase YgiN
MKKLKLILIIGIILVNIDTYSQNRNADKSHASSAIMVRIAEIEIHAASAAAYSAILKEEAAASLKLEPGVLAIFPMFQKADSTQVRILEIYASKEAYQLHLKTPHFLKYKTTTSDMVKSLKLVEMDAIDPETIPLIFRKKN